MKKTLSFILSLFIITTLYTFGQKSSVAISGYDPVSYFIGTPSAGNSSISSKYDGSTYYFISKESKGTFDKKPAKYSPQYGGWCAYAMGLDGSKVVINPMNYKMIKGKLYLFYKKGTVDTKIKWNKQEETLKRNADKNWASNN